MKTDTEIECCDAEVTADAVLQIRIPPFKIRYLAGERDSAKEDALRYARKLLKEEFERQSSRIDDCVRAEVSFSDKEGRYTERLIGHGHWVRWYPETTEPLLVTP